jgi:SAM-dependent methyltransferase
MRVLEIGSGRGGGASYLARYRGATEVTGADFSAEAIAFCQSRHRQVRNLTFAFGDAERLPFAEGAFDAIINIESSHCYGHVDRFFREAVRVLRPGGHFLFADVRVAGAMPALAALLDSEPAWTTVETEDITGGVVSALEQDDAKKRQLIAELVPERRRKVLGEFAALTDTPMFARFRDRRLLYHRFVCRKR